MSDPLHIIVTLSPETIAALAEAMRPKPRGATRYQRPPFGRRPEAPSNLCDERVVAAIKNLEPAFTLRSMMNMLGVPPERQDRAAVTRLGIALRRLGYQPAARRQDGTRERIYSAPQGTGAHPSP